MSETLQLVFNTQQAIRTSPVGKKLNNIERWSSFRTDESRGLWLELLGPTAVVLTHQEYFLEFVQQWGQQLKYDYKNPLLIASSVHDIGEVTVGDTAAPQKKPSDKNDETTAALNQIGLLPIRHESATTLKENYLAVVHGDSQALNYLFKSLERSEYLDTAIHLYDKLLEGLQMEKGLLMIARVLAFDLPKIIRYAQPLPNVVGLFLKNKSQLISEMFKFSESAVSDSFRPQFEKAKQLWGNYLRSS